ncbi:MAG: DNA replication and repair protein RecF [Mariprofundales bacterium]
MIRNDLTLEYLSLHNLRCHIKYDCQLAKGINMFVGENGSGKTSILEAVSLLAYGRSFRQHRDARLMRWDADAINVQQGLQVQGRWQRFGPILSEARAKGATNKMTIRLQGQIISNRKEMLNLLPVIIEAPQGERLIDGTTSERRRWLDRVCIMWNEYAEVCLRAYLRAIMQRNRLLRKPSNNSSSNYNSNELDVWEQGIVHYGMQIMQIRHDIIQRINHALANEQALTEQLFALKIRSNAPEDAELWHVLLAENRSKDSKQGCRIGPHCNVLALLYGGKEVRNSGSRGQQRLSATALRLAQWQLLYQKQGIAPVLLLDDCLEALDNTRQQRLLQRLEKLSAQVLLTAPMMPSVEVVSRIHKVATATKRCLLPV